MIDSTAPALKGKRIVDHAGLAPREAGACAAVGVDLNYAALEERGSMLMVRVRGFPRPSPPPPCYTPLEPGAAPSYAPHRTVSILTIGHLE